MIQPIGYFKIYRELFNKPIWLNSTPEQKTILMTIIAKANFGPKEWEWKGEKYILQKGQFITSLDNLAQDCGKGISIQNVRTALKRFEKFDFLTNESTKQNRLITIVNWELYQGSEDEPNKATNRQLTNDQQTPNKQLTTREEVKKDKKEKNINNNLRCNKSSNTEPVIKFEDNSFEIQLVNYLIMKILETLPNARVPDVTNLSDKQKWAIHVDRMKRIDKRTEEDIRKVVKFATTDSFWQTNILSTKKLREKYDTLYAQANRKKVKNTDDLLEQMKDW